MKSLTRKQQLENVDLMITFFEGLHEREVSPNLSRWRDMGKDAPSIVNGRPSCGSAACIGGWVAAHPHFKQYGVEQDGIDGAPMMPDTLFTSVIADRLFGASELFAPAADYELEQSGGSSQTVALTRLRIARENLIT